MIIKFKYGFYEGNMLYGWHKKHPYRLPQTINGKFYPLHKAGVFEPRGLFYINRKLRSVKQLQSKTVVIHQEVHVIEDSDVPF